ncbi:MAG: acyl-CoA thioesterase [Candidatus Spyradocola sp.]|nr:acyl-CoA thioesterase [Candidatus Spyradocola sp.]
MEAKPARLSRTVQTQIVLNEHINGAGRLFGGRLMEWIDIVAGVAARRHSGRNVTTASVDTLSFKAPAYLNDTVSIEGVVTCTGRTSMEVRVDTYVEALDGQRSMINRAYLVLVALDAQGHPTPVPPLLAETDEERAEQEAGLRRNALRKQRQKEQF